MKRNIKSILKFFLLSAVTVVFTVLLFRIFKSKAYIRVDPVNGKYVVGNGIEPLEPRDVSQKIFSLMDKLF